MSRSGELPPERRLALVIVIVGRPALRSPGEGSTPVPGGLTVAVAMGLARIGLRTELVGSVGEDDEGDRLVLELGRAGVGHAALLRDPSARTLVLPTAEDRSAEGGTTAPVRSTGERGGPPRVPRLEAADIELGLRYLPDCRVLVLTEPLEEGSRHAALEGAAFHGAHVIAVVPQGWHLPQDPAIPATILASPVEGEQGTGFSAFLVAYAAGIARGDEPAEAFRAALDGSGWHPSDGGSGP